MKKTLGRIGMALAAPALLAAIPAHAADDTAPKQGKIQVKLLATAVLPDGKIDTVQSILPALASMSAFSNPQTKANDNVTPTIAVEYFFTPNISVETIAGLTAHHVNGRDSLDGANLVNHVLIIPSTLTVKYHLPLGPVKPYVGVGPSLFLVMGERPGDTARALGVTSTKLSSNVGVALQAGVDIPLGKTPYSISFDAKRYFMKTTAKFYAGDTLALATSHKLDPWLLSAGVAYRF